MLSLRCPPQVAAPTAHPRLPTTAVATVAWAPRSLWPPTALVPCQRGPALALVQSAWLPLRQSKLQPRSEPSHPHPAVVGVLVCDRCVCADEGGKADLQPEGQLRGHQEQRLSAGTGIHAVPGRWWQRRRWRRWWWWWRWRRQQQQQQWWLLLLCFSLHPHTDPHPQHHLRL